MKKLFYLGAMVCALGMMTACKSDNKNNENNVFDKPREEELAIIPRRENVGAKKPTII